MDVVKQGYVKVRSKRLSLWKKRWIILRRASSKGPVRMELYTDEKTSRCPRYSNPPKTILLNCVSNVCRLSSEVKVHSFAISFDHSNHSIPTKWFACDSDLEADSWVKLLIQESLIPEAGLATGEPDILSPGIQKELQEQFHVYLMPNGKLDAFGECLLQVTPENIYLWDVTNSKLKLCAWPLTALRRYGSDPTKFTFEAGRHCATGEGMFIFHTLVGEKIYRKVHQATLAIAEAHQKSKRHPTLMSTSCSNNSNNSNALNTSSNSSSTTQKPPQFTTATTSPSQSSSSSSTSISDEVGETTIIATKKSTLSSSSYDQDMITSDTLKGGDPVNSTNCSSGLVSDVIKKSEHHPRHHSSLEEPASFYSAQTHLTQPTTCLNLEELEAVTV